MRTLSVLLTASVFVVFAHNVCAQEPNENILDDYTYKIVSSSSTGVAPTSGRKYNIQFGQRCRLKKEVTKQYVTALADSLYEASSLDKAIAFLYMQEMDTAGGAYARAFVENGRVTEQSVEEYLIRYNDQLKALPVCESR